MRIGMDLVAMLEQMAVATLWEATARRPEGGGVVKWAAVQCSGQGRRTSG